MEPWADRAKGGGMQLSQGAQRATAHLNTSCVAQLHTNYIARKLL